MDNNQNLLSNDLQIDPVSHIHLKEAATWAKFLGILGIVVSVIMAIAAFFVGTFISSMSDPFNRYNFNTVASGGLTFFYLMVAVIIFLISLYLYRFATKMKIALQNTDQSALNLSFQNLKVYFRILGIITAIYLAFMVLGIVVSIGVVATGR